jgi:hypothetical protein
MQHMPADSVPDFVHSVQPFASNNGHSSESYLPVTTLPQLGSQGFTHPADGHWLKLPAGMVQMALTESLAVVRVVLLVWQRTMQQTGSFPPREPLYLQLSYAYFMRGGRMPHRTVVRGLQEAVARGYLLRQRVGKQQWAYALAWKAGIKRHP